MIPKNLGNLQAKPIVYLTNHNGQRLALNLFERISSNPLCGDLYDYSCVLFKQVIRLTKKSRMTKITHK